MSLLKQYHHKLAQFKQNLQQDPLYPFSEILIEDRPNLLLGFTGELFEIQSESFHFHPHYTPISDELLDLACIFSYLAPGYRDNPKIRDLVSLKFLSDHQDQALFKKYYTQKLGLFVQNFKKFNFFAQDLTSFFDFIPLDVLLFDFLARIQPSRNGDLYFSFHQHILTYFIPDRTFGMIRHALPLSSDLQNLLDTKSDRLYLEFQKNYPFLVCFKIGYSKFKLHIVKVALQLHGNISSDFFQHLATNNFTRNLQIDGNLISWYVVIPVTSVEHLKTKIMHMRGSPHVKSIRMDIYTSQEIQLKFHSEISSSVKIFNIFPFVHSIFTKPIDLRKKRSYSNENCTTIQYHNQCALYSEHLRDIRPEFFPYLIFKASLMLLPTPKSLTSYCKNIHTTLELNAIFNHFQQHKKHSLAKICEFPVSPSDLQEIHDNLHMYFANGAKIRFFTKKRILKDLAAMKDNDMLEVDLPSSLVQNLYCHPDVIDLLVFSKHKNPILERCTFTLECNTFSNTYNQEYYQSRYTINCLYFDLFVKYLTYNASECHLFNYSIFSTDPYYYPLLFYDAQHNQYFSHLFNAKIDQMVQQIQSHLEASPKSFRELEFLESSSTPVPTFYDFLGDLKRVNQLKSIADKLKIEDSDAFFEICKHWFSHECPIQTSFTEGNLSNSIRFTLESLIQEENPSTPPSSHKSLLLVLTTHQNTHPELLYHDPFWRALFSFGLIRYYYLPAGHRYLHYFLYTLPEAVIINEHSPFRRFLAKFRRYDSPQIRVYDIPKYFAGMNPGMIHPHDTVASQYVNLSVKQQNGKFQQIQKSLAPFWRELSPANLHSTMLPKSARCLWKYGVDIAILVEKLEAIPQDFMEFLYQNPIVHCYHLQSYFPGKTSPPRKGVLAIVSLNRYVNAYYNILIRQLLTRFSPDQVTFSPVLDFAVMNPTHAITQIIQQSRRIPPEAFRLPLMYYRLRKHSFSVTYQALVAQFLTDHHLWGHLTHERLLALKQQGSEFDQHHEHFNDAVTAALFRLLKSIFC